MGVLYLVATPIGNLEDITLRAIRVLTEVSLIAAEDTRHSGRLLKHYGIETPMLSYHEHSPPARRDEIIQALETGDVALISDAGMPAVSDPGYDLVRTAAERGYPVTPVPGASAVTAAAAVSGLVPGGFLFLGFPPRRSRERRALFESVAPLPYPSILYEAPHRLRATLADLEATVGDRPITLCREMTKLHEETIRTGVAQAVTRYAEQTPRGEFVLVVDGAGPEVLEPDAEEPAALLEERLIAGDSPSAAAKAVAQRTGLTRSDLYTDALEIQRRLRGETNE